MGTLFHGVTRPSAQATLEKTAREFLIVARGGQLATHGNNPFYVMRHPVCESNLALLIASLIGGNRRYDGGDWHVGQLSRFESSAGNCNRYIGCRSTPIHGRRYDFINRPHLHVPYPHKRSWHMGCAAEALYHRRRIVGKARLDRHGTDYKDSRAKEPVKLSCESTLRVKIPTHPPYARFALVPYSQNRGHTTAVAEQSKARSRETFDCPHWFNTVS